MEKIKLTRGKVAIVDKEDFVRVNMFTWYFDGKYARRDTGGRKNKKRIYMHRFIIGDTDLEVDHINRDPLDNRKSNLRICLHKENIRNSPKHKDVASGIKGVYKRSEKRRKMWYSRIMVDGKDVHLGYYLTAKEAEKAYREASIKYHGEYSPFK